MEIFRLRKYSSSASTGDSSTSRRLSEGNRRVQTNFPKSAFGYGTSAKNIDTVAGNLVKCDSGWRSSNRTTGTPIKNLVAEEMLRETEPRKRSPGVIARLMGFDGLPPQQLSHKQPKRKAENYQQRIISTERSQKSSTSCNHRSSRRSSMEEQEFKDVYEVSDSSKVESRCHSLKGPATSKLTDAEMTCVKQTRLSTDEKLQDSEEFYDAIEDLHTNQDLLLEHLEVPDSLFTEHLHDLQADPLPYHCSHISGMKLSNAPGHEGNGLGGKIEREILWKLRKNHNKPLTPSKNKHSVETSYLESLKFQVDGEVQSSVLPTRIVVLKPKCGEVQNATGSGSTPPNSHNFALDSKKPSEFSGVLDWEVELCAKKRLHSDAMLRKYKSKESREIAKKISRQMRNNLENGHTKISTSGFKGYAGDESSSNRSDDESANESNLPSLASGNSIHRSSRYRPLFSSFGESSVSKEARKRLSERWKRTHRSVDMGTIGRGCTLGEMLSIPDKEARNTNVDAMVVGEKGFTGELVGIDRPIRWVEPLGISSWDGWKDGCARNFSTSRFVPASSTTLGSSRTDVIRGTLCNEKYFLPKEVGQPERNKSTKGNFNHRGASSSRNSSSHAPESHFSAFSYTDYSDTLPEIKLRHKKVLNRMIEDDRIEKAVVTDSRLDPQDVVTIGNAAMATKPNTDAESSVYTMAQDSFSTISQESSFVPLEKGSVAKYSAAELESPGSSKEAEQPSPVSVLETPFPDDQSFSSEFFESVSADIHGLWMQIQQLKSDTESFKEGDMIVQSLEDKKIHEKKGKTEGFKEFSYIKDVLTESGINITDHDSFIASLDVSQCPVNLQVFEELEKHWSLGYWPRCERKLLFDSMNSALVAMKQQFSGMHPCAKGRVMGWIRNGVEENIRKVLEIEQKNVNRDVFVVDLQRVDLRDDVDTVERDIEKMLMEELTNEIIIGM